MINCSSSSNRDVDTDEDTNAELLNEVNADGDRTGSFEATSGGSSYVSSEKSESIIIKPTKETK